MKTAKQPTTAAVRVNPVIKKGTKMGGGAIKRNTLLWLKNAYFPQNEQKIMLHNCIFLLSLLRAAPDRNLMSSLSGRGRKLSVVCGLPAPLLGRTRTAFDSSFLLFFRHSEASVTVMTRRVAQLQSAAVMQLFGTLTTKEEAQSDGRKCVCSST